MSIIMCIIHACGRFTVASSAYLLLHSQRVGVEVYDMNFK